PMSMFAFTPRTPIVPLMLGINPGTAIVNCHGSLCVTFGGAVSFGASSREPARTGAASATAAEMNKTNLIFMCRVLTYEGFNGERGVAVIAADFEATPATRLWDFGAMSTDPLDRYNGPRPPMIEVSIDCEEHETDQQETQKRFAQPGFTVERERLGVPS